VIDSPRSKTVPHPRPNTVRSALNSYSDCDLSISCFGEEEAQSAISHGDRSIHFA
jgi:hypothetical protein